MYLFTLFIYVDSQHQCHVIFSECGKSEYTFHFSLLDEYINFKIVHKFLYCFVFNNSVLVNQLHIDKRNDYVFAKYIIPICDKPQAQALKKNFLVEQKINIRFMHPSQRASMKETSRGRLHTVVLEIYASIK